MATYYHDTGPSAAPENVPDYDTRRPIEECEACGTDQGKLYSDGLGGRLCWDCLQRPEVAEYVAFVESQ